MQIADDLILRIAGGLAMQPAEVAIEAPGLVDRHEYRKVVNLRKLEVLGATPGRNVNDPAPLLERDLVPGRTRCVTSVTAGR